MTLLAFLLSLAGVLLVSAAFVLGVLWGMMWIFIWALRLVFKEGD